MITVNITWHLLLMCIGTIVWFFYGLSLDNTHGFLGTAMGWYFAITTLLVVCAWLIYGGIVWW